MTTTLQDMQARITAAAAHGRTAVARELARAGLEFDIDFNQRLRRRFSEYPGQSMFHKCIVEAAHWGGLVDDPAWPVDGIKYLNYETPEIAQKYGRGYHSKTQPTEYLKTWARILENRNLPAEPDEGSSVHDVVRFYQSAEAALFEVDWRDQRKWVGPWTFYGVFKLYLLHQPELWEETNVDIIVMPMGGEKSRGSFEGGCDFLVELGIQEPLPKTNKALKGFPKRIFDEGMARTKQAHAGVMSLASAADSRALHVNSGIFLLGSGD